MKKALISLAILGVFALPVQASGISVGVNIGVPYGNVYYGGVYGNQYGTIYGGVPAAAFVIPMLSVNGGHYHYHNHSGWNYDHRVGNKNNRRNYRRSRR